MAESSQSPLNGKRIVITRAALQAAKLAEELTARGATATLLPLVSFAPPEDYAPLDAALLRLDQFDWIIFTSAKAVDAVSSRSTHLRRPLHQAPKPSHVAAVGPETGKEAHSAGFSIDYVARSHNGVALAEELGGRLRGQSVFLPRSDRANPDMPAALRRYGANVTEVTAYRTLPPTDLDRGKIAYVVAAKPHAILFFSPTAVEHFDKLADSSAKLSALQDVLAITAIGPVTATALQDHGVRRIVVAADTSASAIIAALEHHYAASRTPNQTVTGAMPA